MFDLPRSKEWLTYTEWSKTYGDILSISAFGQTVIVLSSPEDIKELFIHRASNYSNRIRLTMTDLVGWRDGAATSPLGEKFRTMRRFMMQILGPRATKQPEYIEIEEAAVNAFLRRCIADGDHPKELKSQLLRLTATVILKLTYGYDVEADDDAFMRLSEHALHVFHTVSQPGWLVDVLPILQYLPTWFPFLNFKRKAAEWRKVVETSRKTTLDWTRDQLQAGTAGRSFASTLLEDAERMKEENLFSVVLGDLFAAGEDTTMTTGAKLFLALALHPDVQAKAQQEIDTLTSSTRLPTYADRAHLPYLEALLKEVHRWNTPVAPLGIPHCVSEEDEYKGYRIPKGAIIFPNVWSIFENPEKYPEPDVFKPERFLGAAAEDGINEDPTRYAFGFGTRICPGRHLADSTQWVLAAKVLASCTVSDARDARTGCELAKTGVEYLPGVVSQPAPFTCRVVPRSAVTEALLSSE